MEEYWGMDKEPIVVECLLSEVDARKGLLGLRDQSTKCLPTQTPLMKMKLYTEAEVDECQPCVVCGTS